MGDRTTVQITIRKGDFERLVEKHGGQEQFEDKVCAEEVEVDHKSNLVNLTCFEVNYAEWDELEDLLREDEINFDKHWGAGGNYEAGSSYARKVEGIYRSFENYTCDEVELSTLKEIKEMLEKEPKAKVLKHLENMILEKEPFTPVPLDQPNSIRFIKEA